MNSARTSTLDIRTPEGIVFSLPLAGPTVRFLAFVIDLSTVMVVTQFVASMALLVVTVSPDLARALRILLPFVVQVGYGIGCEWFWRGQTVGKWILRLRVMDAQGLRLQPSQVVIRNLLRPVDQLPLLGLVGAVAMFLNRHNQRLGDLAANTVVVRMPRLREPDLEQMFAGKYNSMREHPHLGARLRQRVTPAEAAVALQALLRRDELDPAARVELFGAIAAQFRELVEFPPDVVEGITDEQWVRNVVDVVFRARPGESPAPGAGGEVGELAQPLAGQR
jgi:uncharacterized RDD family membrane protein YckC